MYKTISIDTIRCKSFSIDCILKRSVPASFFKLLPQTLKAPSWPSTVFYLSHEDLFRLLPATYKKKGKQTSALFVLYTFYLQTEQTQTHNLN